MTIWDVLEAQVVALGAAIENGATRVVAAQLNAMEQVIALARRADELAAGAAAAPEPCLHPPEALVDAGSTFTRSVKQCLLCKTVLEHDRGHQTEDRTADPTPTGVVDG